MFMNEERIRIIEFRLKVKKGKEYEIEKHESFFIKRYDNKKYRVEKTINFQLDDGKDYKFGIILYPSKGFFGDKILPVSLSQSEFMSEQEPVDVISFDAKFEKNP